MFACGDRFCKYSAFQKSWPDYFSPNAIYFFGQTLTSIQILRWCRGVNDFRDYGGDESEEEIGAWMRNFAHNSHEAV
jgi:hypothetical protein